MRKIIIVAPYGLVTGGAELLHQLCSCLNDNSMNAYIGYTIDDSHGAIFWAGQSEVIKEYSNYNINVLDVNKNQITSDDIFVISETALEMLPMLTANQTFIWWLSVDNYLKCLRQDYINYAPVSFKDKPNILHLVQSWYAYRFLVESAGVDDDKIFWLSDYIKDSFLQESYDISRKKNQIVYNPAKGFERLKKIIEDTPEYNWIPIRNMTPDQVAEILRISKVYIDFGNHPGKDRIPREAAACRCCIITNRMGAAAYYEDISIPNKYKFTDVVDEETEVIGLIQEIFDHFEDHLKEFEEYRFKISQEKNEFFIDATQTFKQFV